MKPEHFKEFCHAVLDADGADPDDKMFYRAIVVGLSGMNVDPVDNESAKSGYEIGRTIYLNNR